MRRKHGFKLLALFVAAALCLAALPISVSAAESVSTRGITYTVRIDGDDLLSTTVVDFPYERDKTHSVGHRFSLYNNVVMPGGLLWTEVGLVNVSNFPDLGNVHITKATYHLTSTQASSKALSLYEITSEFAPVFATWNTRPDYDTSRSYNYTADSTGYNFDITDLARTWEPGKDHGMALTIDNVGEMTTVGGQDDYIEIQYTPVSTVRVDDSALSCVAISDYPFYADQHLYNGEMGLYSNTIVPGGLRMTQHGLMRISLPSIGSRTVTKATLHLDMTSSNAGVMDVGLHAITSDWMFSTVTWNTRPSYSSEVEAVNYLDSAADYNFDITSLVQKIYAGEATGILFELLEPEQYLNIVSAGGWIDLEYA